MCESYKLLEECVKSLACIAEGGISPKFDSQVLLVVGTLDSAYCSGKLTLAESYIQLRSVLEELIQRYRRYSGTSSFGASSRVDINALAYSKLEPANGNAHEILQQSCSIRLDGSAETRIKQAVSGAIVTKKMSGSLDCIAGLEEAKMILREAVVLPLQQPQLFVGLRRPWQRILLYGPPGTGKTRLAHGIANCTSRVFYTVSSSVIMSSWVGESEKTVRDLFAHARANSHRSILFFDEIDSLCRRRQSHDEEHNRRVKSELLRQLDECSYTESTSSSTLELHHPSDDGPVILGATNCPWDLDTAFLRRFEKRIYVPLPNSSARLQLLKTLLLQQKTELNQQEVQRLVDLTAGYSGCDIQNLVKTASFEPVRRLQQNQFWKISTDGTYSPCQLDYPAAVHSSLLDLPKGLVDIPAVTISDFLQALQKVLPTVTEEELQTFEDFTKKYGEKA